MKVKEESEKVDLKLTIQNTKIMPSSPHANRWGNNGNSDRKDFIFLESKITVNGDCSHEIQNTALWGKKQ